MFLGLMGLLLLLVLASSLQGIGALTFRFRCKATGPPKVEPYYFGFISDGSKVDGKDGEWSEWRDYVAQDQGDARVTQEIAPGVYKIRMYVSNVDPARITPVEMEVEKENGLLVSFNFRLFSGSLGLVVTCADTVSCGSYSPVFFSAAQYEGFRYFSKMPNATTPPRRFPVVGRFIGYTGDLNEWESGSLALKNTGYNVLHLPAERALGNMIKGWGTQRFMHAVYSPPGGSFGQGQTNDNIYWGVDGWAMAMADSYSQAGFNVSDSMTGFALADEPGYYLPSTVDSMWNRDGPRVQADFELYLKARGLTPALLGATDWAGVTPVGRGSAADSLPAKRRFYWTARFLAHYSVEFFALATAAMERHFPGATTMVNWNAFQGRLYTPGGTDNNPEKSSPDSASCATDWFEHARQRGSSLVWTADWFGDANARQWTYYAGRLRGAASLAQNGVEYGGYIIARMSQGSNALVAKIIALVGSGAKTLNIYTFGPEFLFKDNSYSDRYGIYPFLTKAFDMIGASEDVLLPGRRPTAQAAILYPRSSFIWDPTGVQDFTNTNPNVKSMDYHVDLYGMFQLLSNVLNYQVDFIDEDALLEPDVLQQYKLVFVSEPNVPRAGQAALLQYAQAGGTVWLSGAGAARDEYNQVSEVFDVCAKLQPSSPAVTYNAWAGGPTGEGTGDQGDFISFGPRATVEAKGSDATVRATFSDDGSPAIASVSVGSGRVVRYMWSLGYTWNANGWLGGADKYLLWELQTVQARRPVWTNISDCRKSGGVHRGVETALLASEAGVAVTVMNWCGNDMVTHADIHVELDFMPKQVHSAAQKAQIPFTMEGNVVTVPNVQLTEIVDILSIIPDSPATSARPTPSIPEGPSSSPTRMPSTPLLSNAQSKWQRSPYIMGSGNTFALCSIVTCLLLGLPSLL